MNRRVSLFTLTLLAALPLGCASHHQPGAHQATLSGTVTFPGNLPVDATLTVYLVENTSISETVEVLANVMIPFKHGSPAAYEITYNPAEVEPENRYSLIARAVAPDGEVLLKSNAHMVLTKGGPSDHVAIAMSSAKSGY